MRRAQRFICRLVAASIVPWLGGASAHASQEVWRYPEEPVLQGMPAVLELSRPEVSELERKVSKRSRKRGAAIPEIQIQVADREGMPVSGVGVSVWAQMGSESRQKIRLRGATGEDGSVVLRGHDTTGFTKLGFDLEWGGGAKVVSAYVKPTKTGWTLAQAPYKNVFDRSDEGSCRNLFSLERGDSERAYRLRFRLPETLLECEQVSYGVDRKSAELARVGEIGRRDLNQGDKNFFARDAEQRMGLEAASKLDEELELIEDREVVGYLESVMGKVVAASDEPDMPVLLRVVHTDAVNAFVTPGGHVYVFTGLILAAENESQLAGVLAHEASHAIARHGTEGATRGIKAQLGTILAAIVLGEALDLGNAEQRALLQGSLITAGIVGMRYSRQAETEADLLGSQYLWNAGWDPEGIARFFEVLERQGGSSMPGWLSTHPSHDRRIQNGIHWAGAYLPPRERYLLTTADFERVRERVKALPPPRDEASPLAGKSIMELMGGTASFQEAIASGLPALLAGVAEE